MASSWCKGWVAVCMTVVLGLMIGCGGPGPGSGPGAQPREIDQNAIGVHEQMKSAVTAKDTDKMWGLLHKMSTGIYDGIAATLKGEEASNPKYARYEDAARAGLADASTATGRSVFDALLTKKDLGI